MEMNAITYGVLVVLALAAGFIYLVPKAARDLGIKLIAHAKGMEASRKAYREAVTTVYEEAKQ